MKYLQIKGGDFASIPHIASTYIRTNYIRPVYRSRSHIFLLTDWLIDSLVKRRL